MTKEELDSIARKYADRSTGVHAGRWGAAMRGFEDGFVAGLEEARRQLGGYDYDLRAAIAKMNAGAK